ncbi:MAG TPA: SpoIIE family protein phosphatase [Chloroflexia bacterium]|nr:SpoIIE family protein phosphatase [Chloroflexia bacterium]
MAGQQIGFSKEDFKPEQQNLSMALRVRRARGLDCMEPQNTTILVVDDNENNRDTLARILKRQEYTVASAENGQEALLFLEAEPVDLILLDIMMPIMSGYEVLEHLKADPARRHIPVIVVSALDEIESVVRCIELGAEDYLTKPFNRVLLKARVGASLEKKRLRDQEQYYLQAARRELEIGRNIQADFLPSSLPSLVNWDLDARFKPAREVAGDFYDTFSLGDNLVGLVIADVCDKGVGAALFMALTRSILRVLAQQSNTRLSYSSPDPQTRLLVELKEPASGAVHLVLPASTFEILNAVALTNSYITATHRGTIMFATLFFGVMDTRTGYFYYVNAGHDAPIHWSKTGLKARLNLTGPAVGIMPRARYKIGFSQFEPGDCLLMYTDGIPEARDPASNFFTEKRLLEFMEEAQAGPSMPVRELLDSLEVTLQGHIAGAEPSDDITMLCIQRLA